MIQLEFSEMDKEELRKNRFLHPDFEVQRRSEILLLCAHGIPHEKIAEIFACHRNTITNTARRYHEKGLPGLLSRPRPGRSSKLKPHLQEITDFLEKNPVRSINEACVQIKEITGISRKPTQVRSMLHHLGFKRLMSGAMPCPKKKHQKNMYWIRSRS